MENKTFDNGSIRCVFIFFWLFFVSFEIDAQQKEKTIPSFEVELVVSNSLRYEYLINLDEVIITTTNYIPRKRNPMKVKKIERKSFSYKYEKEQMLSLEHFIRNKEMDKRETYNVRGHQSGFLWEITLLENGKVTKIDLPNCFTFELKELLLLVNSFLPNDHKNLITYD